MVALWWFRCFLLDWPFYSPLVNSGYLVLPLSSGACLWLVGLVSVR